MIPGDEARSRFLASYFYLRMQGDTLEESLVRWFGERPARADIDMFVDSGAFTALSSGNPIDVHEYGRWLTAGGLDTVQVVANLDVIGNDRASAEATWRNYLVLRDEYGVPVIPVVHVGEPVEMLDRYLDRGEDYIALGGLVGRRWKVALPWVLQAWRRVGEHAVFHGFGLTHTDALSDLPWYSVDSSSWLVGAMYGQVMLHDGRRLKVFSVSDRSAGGNTSRTREFVKLARDHGFDPEALQNPVMRKTHLDSTRATIGVAVEAWSRVELTARRRHGLQYRPSLPSSHPGLRLYLANSQQRWFTHAHAYTPIHRRTTT